MACKHKFEYLGSEKTTRGANKYFKCSVCGCVKVRSDDGLEYLIPAEEESK